jgi:hypothetical protein
MRLNVSLAVLLPLLLAGVGGPVGAQTPYESPAPLTRTNRIDELVLGDLDRLGIAPAALCSDAVFVRRAFLDVIGTLPTFQESRDFLLDRRPDKRRVLIDHLLERPEFSVYWAMKWSDVLRVKAEFPINLWPNAVQTYHRWIQTSLRENLPYDRFARELLTASGSNFRVPPVNFYRAVQSKDPTTLARTVALTFMGTRAEKWPTNQLAGMAAFFSNVGYKTTAEWKEEIVFFDAGLTNASGASAVPPRAVFPDGSEVALSVDRDPRDVFAGWLVNPRNPWFTRNIANRVWAWLLGRGIVHEPDDIRPDNPPVNQALLAYLEQELVAAKYDLKHLYRLILNSQTYQLSSIPKTNHPEAAAHFASYPLRRLEAEVLIDALNQITGTTEKYSSPIPEPFTFIPEDQRSIALADGSTTSAFLEMFGRAPRDTGLESERNSRPSADQRLHLLNSTSIQRKIEQSRKLQFFLQSKGGPREVVSGLYLAILSRFPTEEELRAAQAHAQSGAASGREAAVDLAWALINTAEFLYRH